MIQVQVLKKLLDLDIVITAATLNNYEKWGLIPKPERQNLGRGGGIVTRYAPEAAAEAYASWKLMHDMKIPPGKVSEIRGIALHLGNGGYFSMGDLKADEQLKALAKGKEIEVVFSLQWLRDRNRVFYGENELLFEEMKKVQSERDTAAREGREREADAANDRLVELVDERDRRIFLKKLTAGALLAAIEDCIDDEWTPA